MPTDDSIRRNKIAAFVLLTLKSLNHPTDGAAEITRTLLAGYSTAQLFTGPDETELRHVGAEAALMRVMADRAQPVLDANAPKPEAPKRTYDSTHAEVLALVVAKLKSNGSPTYTAVALAHAILGMEHPSALLDGDGNLDVPLVMTRLADVSKPFVSPYAAPEAPAAKPLELGADSEFCGFETPQKFVAAIPDPQERLRMIAVRDDLRHFAREKEAKKRTAAADLAAQPEGFLDMPPEYRNEWANARAAERKKATA